MSKCAALADRLALVLLEHGALACDPLARQVGSRKADVLAVLETDPRFRHYGSGRDSRWQLVLQPSLEPREHSGTIPSPGCGRKHGREVVERLRALEARVAQLERRFLDRVAQ